MKIITKLIDWILKIWSSVDKETKDEIIGILLKMWKYILEKYYDKSKENKKEETK